MKKIIFILFVSFTSIIGLNAECSYKELKELNSFASHVETSYKYNETTGLFDLTITNLGDKVFIRNGINDLFPTDGQLTISNLALGSTFTSTIIGGLNGECGGEILRTIRVNLPYLNKYYNSEKCLGHENLNICNSRFLDYELTERTFYSLIRRNDQEAIEKNKQDNKDEIEELTIIDKIILFIKNNYIKFLLVIGTSVIVTSIYTTIIRKIRHGI